jgi:enamine deaminase RidA (YjgF/YER057c/UK114 family)
MEGRKKIQSGAPWESVAGYSRAVRVNSLVVVSGTASVDDKGDVVGIDDPYRQTQRCLEIIEAALHQAGARVEHVVRTRMFVTDISLWQDFARAHRETFKGIEPATSLVQVAKLIDPRMLIEIEADAVIDDD